MHSILFVKIIGILLLMREPWQSDLPKVQIRKNELSLMFLINPSNFSQGGI